MLGSKKVSTCSLLSHFSRKGSHILALSTRSVLAIIRIAGVITFSLTFVALALLSVDSSRVWRELIRSLALVATGASLKGFSGNWEEGRINGRHCLSSFQMMIKAVGVFPHSNGLSILHQKFSVVILDWFFTRVIVNRVRRLKEKAA